jgi:hypothetical protein
MVFTAKATVLYEDIDAWLSNIMAKDIVQHTADLLNCSDLCHAEEYCFALIWAVTSMAVNNVATQIYDDKNLYGGVVMASKDWIGWIAAILPTTGHQGGKKGCNGAF